MKNKIILLVGVFTLIALTTQMNAQNSYLKDGACWRGTVAYAGGTYSQDYFFRGDTIIEEKKYVKVYYDDKSYAGCLREEEGKVYTIENFGEDSEFLLYDFTLNVGDVIKSTALHGYLSYGEGATVTDIEEITLKNGDKKKLFFIEGSRDIWVEGIGSLFHPFEGLMEYTTCGGNKAFLKEYELDGEIILSREELCAVLINCGWYSINENESIREFSVDFDSKTKQITIASTSNKMDEVIISIYDAKGTFVKQVVIENPSGSIDASGFIAGVYFYSISGDRIIQSGKIAVN